MTGVPVALRNKCVSSHCYTITATEQTTGRLQRKLTELAYYFYYSLQVLVCSVSSLAEIEWVITQETPFSVLQNSPPYCCFLGTKLWLYSFRGVSEGKCYYSF